MTEINELVSEAICAMSPISLSENPPMRRLSIGPMAQICRKIYGGSGSVRSSHQSVSGASKKKLVLPFTFDTSLSSLMM